MSLIFLPVISPFIGYRPLLNHPCPSGLLPAPMILSWKVCTLDNVREFSAVVSFGGSSQSRWDRLDCFGELLVKARIHGTMPDGCACRILAEKVATFPVVVRPDRPGTKASATIRADIVQDVFDAGTAEGAFKRANHCVSGIRRKRRVAVLAYRSQFKHSDVLMRGWRHDERAVNSIC